MSIALFTSADGTSYYVTNTYTDELGASHVLGVNYTDLSDTEHQIFWDQYPQDGTPGVDAVYTFKLVGNYTFELKNPLVFKL